MNKWFLAYGILRWSSLILIVVSCNSAADKVVGNGIVVDISKYFNKIIEVNPTDKWVRVEFACKKCGGLKVEKI